MERLGGKVAAKGEDTAATEQATKQATAVLNRFLEHFSKIKEVTSPRLKELKVFLFFCIFHYRFQFHRFLRSLGMPLRISAHEMLILNWVPWAYKVSLKSVATEGRLDFRPLPMGGSLTVPRSYSRGLPSQVYATWEGPWQVEPVHCLWQGVFPPIVAIPNLHIFVQLYWKQECLLGGPILGNTHMPSFWNTMRVTLGL